MYTSMQTVEACVLIDISDLRLVLVILFSLSINITKLLYGFIFTCYIQAYRPI